MNFGIFHYMEMINEGIVVLILFDRFKVVIFVIHYNCSYNGHYFPDILVKCIISMQFVSYRDHA